MRYIKPEYLNEALEPNDVILASGMDLGNGASLTKINEGSAQVSASASDVLGLR